VILNVVETSVANSRPSVPYGANLFCVSCRTDRQCWKSIMAGTGFRNKTVDTCTTAWVLFWMHWETGSNGRPRRNQYVVLLWKITPCILYHIL